MKYQELEDFASSFLFYGTDRDLLYDTTTLEDNPTNRVYRDGFHEREWDLNVNPTGFEPRDVYFVAAVEPEGTSAMIRCVRTSL